ncbi:cobalt-precorrin-6A reductase [Comamonas serinivorans]|uniref:Cobalt-precorrin-6A reductase n=1 Tax=Comamonas serinivorans TaxID=1082851 RepID=A0A1Y0EQT2_9BURK|nr:cobalt-precorrin-6A reductase [Comamonas serinivorans]ARU05612.1 cobalt-precorrin-6A reductase [Comamonas serinivorans]
MTHILLLGGTHGARVLAALLQQDGVPATYSYAGVTQQPRLPALPTRVGGFGGVQGLTRYLTAHGITHVIDATHPFAAQMSRHAVQACAALGLPLLALERPPWPQQPGDDWIHVADMAAAAAALPMGAERVFLAIGRKQLMAFAACEHRRFLLRVVDAPEAPLPLPAHDLVVARGPFSLADEVDLLRRHRIACLVSKNAGGADTYAKIEAARQLGLPVVMVARPAIPPRTVCQTPEQAMAWLRRR